MGPPMWPWRCGLMARPVSGVEWSGPLYTSAAVLIQNSISTLVTDPTAFAGKLKQLVASICLSVRMFPLCLLNRLTFDLEFLYVYES